MTARTHGRKSQARVSTKKYKPLTFTSSVGTCNSTRDIVGHRTMPQTRKQPRALTRTYVTPASNKKKFVARIVDTGTHTEQKCSSPTVGGAVECLREKLGRR